MSFSIEFYASSGSDATKLLSAESNLPQSVRDFVAAALKACTGPTYVKAMGHLSNNDYPVSNAVLEIRPIMFSIPKT